MTSKRLFVCFNLGFTADSWWILPSEYGLALQNPIDLLPGFTSQTSKRFSTHYVLFVASFLGWRLLSTFHLLFAYSWSPECPKRSSICHPAIILWCNFTTKSWPFHRGQPFQQRGSGYECSLSNPRKKVSILVPFLNKKPCRYTLILMIVIIRVYLFL